MHTRPFLDHEIKESTIHQGHVESCHRQAAELSAAFYERMDVVWAGGLSVKNELHERVIARASIDDHCSTSERVAAVAITHRPTVCALERLAWWLAFHLRLGFRWCFPLCTRRENEDSRVEEKVSWIGSAVVCTVQPSKDESVCARDATRALD